jgi:hypothetical protein
VRSVLESTPIAAQKSRKPCRGSSSLPLHDTSADMKRRAHGESLLGRVCVQGLLHLCRSKARHQAQQSETSLVFVHRKQVWTKLLPVNLGWSTTMEISSESNEILALRSKFHTARAPPRVWGVGSPALHSLYAAALDMLLYFATVSQSSPLFLGGETPRGWHRRPAWFLGHRG